MHLRTVAWVALLITLLAGCSRSGPTPAPPHLTWTGKGLEGLVFHQLPGQGAIVHYAAPTSKSAAEKLRGDLELHVAKQLEYGRADRFTMVSVWLVPVGAPWPAGLAEPPKGRSFRAVGPLLVVGREGDQPANGLAEAVGLALTQVADSPALQVDWLHEGMGAVMASSWARFPLPWWQPPRQAALPAAEALRRLQQDPPESETYRAAAAALAALVMERWGVAWPAHYTQPGISPVGALLWATGAGDESVATARWQERIDYMLALPPSRLGMVNAAGELFVPTAADISPVRIDSALPARPPGPGPMANASPHRYEIKATYQPEERKVEGELLLSWQNNEQIPVDALYFNLWPNAEQYARYGGSITVKGARVDGKEAQFTARALDLKVALGSQVHHGESVQVQIHFTTRLPARITLRVFGQDGDSRFNLAHWFPILAVLDDRGWNLYPHPTAVGEPYSETADFHVTLDLPAHTQVAATGKQLSRQESDGRWLYTYQADRVRDWVATGGRGLNETVLQAGKVVIRALDRDENWTRAAAAEAARALLIFEERFGPYTWPELVVTCCAGLEYPGLFYTSPIDGNGRWRVTLYHEMAHQWFFGMVGNDQYGEPWLDEGFARYGERMGMREFGMPLAEGGLATGQLPEGLRVSSSSSAYTLHGNYGLGAYNKGALVLEDLERLVGEAIFDKLLRTWVEQYRGKTATTADFIRVAEEVSGQALGEFFRSHGVAAGDRSPYRPLLPLGRARPDL